MNREEGGHQLSHLYDVVLTAVPPSSKHKSLQKKVPDRYWNVKISSIKFWMCLRIQKWWIIIIIIIIMIIIMVIYTPAFCVNVT
jgi:hypothetical protein